MISTNPGEAPKQLVRTASGGEISRVMLAIKSALARQESLPTMMFDEIDVGVGGRTAHRIADKLENLAQFVQIICITHLAQIASRAGSHLAVEKRMQADETTVQVKTLTEDERLLEVARMLGGLEPTPAVVQHAREMLDLRGKICEAAV
jgi:DNA repair protein RecN (Recombination protein N)